MLLVEDDDDEAHLAELALRKASVGHRLTRARDGDETGSLLGRVPKPDLIVLDLHLPGRDGKAVLQAIRAHPALRHVPVVMYSSSLEARDMASCYSLGANSYLHKGADTRSFVDDMSLVLFYWLCLAALPGESRAHHAGRQASAGVEAEQARSHRFAPPLGAHTDEGRAHDLQFGREASAVVIDADPDLRRRTAESLRQVGGRIPVIEASDRQEAFDALARARMCQGHSPWSCARLVVIDLDSNPDGMAAVHEIRSVVDHRLPIVVYTSNDSPAFLDRCYAMRVSSVVRKPAPASAADTVKLIGHYWLRLNQTIPAPDLLPV